MRHVLAVLTFAATLILTACGGPKPGDTCNSQGFLCEDDATAMECRVGQWRILPCRGPQGCSVSGSQVTCDMTQNREGDNCAAAVEGQGLCDASGAFAMQCRNGSLLRVKDCSGGCQVIGEQISCQ